MRLPIRVASWMSISIPVRAAMAATVCSGASPVQNRQVPMASSNWRQPLMRPMVFATLPASKKSAKGSPSAAGKRLPKVASMVPVLETQVSISSVQRARWSCPLGEPPFSVQTAASAASPPMLREARITPSASSVPISPFLLEMVSSMAATPFTSPQASAQSFCVGPSSSLSVHSMSQDSTQPASVTLTPRSSAR